MLDHLYVLEDIAALEDRQYFSGYIHHLNNAAGKVLKRELRESLA